MATDLHKGCCGVGSASDLCSTNQWDPSREARAWMPELLLEVLPCSLDKLLVAVGVQTKFWSNEVELKARRRLLLPALNPLLHRVAVLDHSRWLLHDNLRVREFPRWT